MPPLIRHGFIVFEHDIAFAFVFSNVALTVRCFHSDAQITAAVQARRKELLLSLGRAGFAQQKLVQDQKSRMHDLQHQADALQVDVLKAIGLPVDQQCVAAYAHVRSRLDGLLPLSPAVAVAGLAPILLEPPAGSSQLEVELDAADALRAVGALGRVRAPAHHVQVR